MSATGSAFPMSAVCESEEMGTTTGSTGGIICLAIPARCHVSLGIQPELEVHLPMLRHEDATMYEALVKSNLEGYIPHPLPLVNAMQS